MSYQINGMEVDEYIEHLRDFYGRRTVIMMVAAYALGVITAWVIK